MTARGQSATGNGGLALAVIAFILLGFVLVGNFGALEVVPRSDAHVETKHGTAARDLLREPGPREYHYSASRETVMVSRCDASTCAVMYIGVRGMAVQRETFRPEMLNGRLELTSHFMSRARREAVIQRDGYVYLGMW